MKIEDTGERLIPEGHKQTLAYGEHLARYRAAEGLVEGKVVLDVATGAGYGTALLAKTAKKVIGIDYSKDAIAYAKSLYGNIKNASFVVADAQDMPIEDNSVDVVVSLETIEHLPDPEKFVQEVRRVLRPDGVFYVSTPNDDEYTEGNEFHLHEFTLKELTKLMDKYFKKTDYYYQGTWYASGILSQSNFENETGEVTAVKTFGQEPKRAIYFLAVATNGKQVPPITENVVVADVFSELQSQREHQARLKIVDNIRDLEGEVKRLDTELSDILNSKGWRLLKKIYSVKSKIRSKPAA